MTRHRPGKRRFVALVLSLLAGTTAWAFLPYWLPVGVALGPCGRDWTSVPNWGRRQSPTARLTTSVDGAPVRVCYGRPQARGRQVFGGLVPWGRRWRLGANEPTRLFTAAPLSVGTVPVPPGRYRLYVIVRPDTWTVVVNGNTFAWGNDFSPGVLAAEIGRFPVVPETTAAAVERLTVVPAERGIAVEWERTRVVIPLERR